MLYISIVDSIFQYIFLLGEKIIWESRHLYKRENGIFTDETKKEAISAIISVDTHLSPTNALVDLSILQGVPFYIRKMAEQMCCCYDVMLYDACLVMMRKLFETLIIECYERHSSAHEIKDANSNFYYLSDLIPLLLSSKHWTVSRNLEKHIKLVKKFGDLSAHNRRFFAKKNEIDELKFELRQCLQELILIIDYDNWDRSNLVTQ